ncbi:MAG: hypothetical protein LUD19_03450, partial [Clostridia bacterium]|nr:hypothetical protein [Clostridia bacterium]
MAAETFRIEIPINVEDNTDPGVSSAREKMTKFDQANEKVKKRLDEMNKTKWRIAIETVDKVTSVISKIGTTVKGITTKAWSVTLSAVDKVTSVAKGIISTLGEILSIGTMVSTVLGGITLMDALEAANTQTQVETQLSTVLQNMADSAEEAETIFDRIKAKASELQQVTLYGDEGYIAGAAELATYFSDADALELMMETLADYATGMSGGAELTTEELVDYATNLGKITTGAYDAMTKKGFEFTDAQKAVIDGTATTAQYIEALGEDWASMSEEMRTAQVISDIIEESWSGLATEMANLPSAKITQFKNAWGDVKEVIGNKLYPAVGDFFAMLSDKLPEVQELLESGAEWLGDAFEDLIPSISDGIDTAISWVKKLAGTVKTMVNSDEWQNADLFGKISIAWDTLIAEPFSEWWNSTGKAFFAEKAGSIGEAIGSGLTTGLLALLGIDISDAMTDGTSVGGAFIEGFKKGFDTEQITEALKEWASNNKEVVVAIGAVVGFNLITGLASKINSLTTLLKGSSSSDGSGTSLGDLVAKCTTMTVTASVVNVYGTTVNSKTTSTSTSGIGSAVKGLLTSAGGAAVGTTAGKLITSGAGQLLLGSGTGSTVAGLLTGGTSAAAGTAAATGLTSAGSWLSSLLTLGSTSSVIGADGTLLAVSGGVGGTLGSIGGALGSTATTAAGAAAAGAAGATGILGMVAGGISSIVDVVQGVGKSKEGDTKGAKDEYVTAGTKVGMMATGAGIGAAIGSVVPGAGTAIGALVGGGIGGIVSLFAGDKAGKAISDSTDEGGALSNAWQATKSFFQEDVANFFTNTLPKGWNSFWGSVGDFFTQTIPQWWGNLTDTVSTFFTETIPEAWNEMWEGIGSFFTETVPYALGYACGKVEIFFTETVPEFFGDLWDSISTFFTDTLPTWASGIWNEHIVPFFTESIPEFFGGIWDAIKTFFTDTLPTWAS